jgi:hypothetical protein
MTNEVCQKELVESDTIGAGIDDRGGSLCVGGGDYAESTPFHARDIWNFENSLVCSGLGIFCS